jgi:hypothetical protein
MEPIFQGNVVQLLARLKRTVSMSQGRRLVFMGAIKINGILAEEITDRDFFATDTIQIGKETITLGEALGEC